MVLFLSLPNELIDAVIEALDDRPTLVALAQSCQKLQPLAEARLFRNIYIHDGPSVARLSKVLELRSERFRIIEHLEVTPMTYAWRHFDYMPELAGRMVRLKSLKVEAPMINSQRRPAWWSEGTVKEYMDLFEGAVGARRGVDMAFGCLTSFTFHSHGTNDRYYNVETVLPVFLSPTLKYVHLSCVDMESRDSLIATIDSHSARTPLETLILERCIVEPGSERSLESILSLPRALRSLTLLIDSVLYSFGHPHLQAQAQTQGLGLLTALQQQSDSLEYLRYTHLSEDITQPGSPEHLTPSLFSSLSTLRESSPGLSPFTRLHTLHLSPQSNLAALLLSQPLAPPALHTLGLTGLDPPSDYSSWHHLPAYLSALTPATPFSHLTLHPLSTHTPPASVSDRLTQPPHRDIVLHLADSLARSGASLTIVCAYQRMPYHPPFLHRETLPVEAVVFDGGKRGGGYARFEVVPYRAEGASGWAGAFAGLGTRPWRGARRR